MSLPALPELLLRLLMALLLGAVVGIEREYRSKSAGFRTMMLISLGACLFTMMSVAIGGPANSDRIAANIATGVGFLGAGVIFRSGSGISGITTAASIWAVAAIGMAAGAGHYWLGCGAALAMLIVLTLLPAVQKWVDIFHQMRSYTITITDSGMLESIEQQIKAYRLSATRIAVNREHGLLKATWHAQGSAQHHEQFTNAMLQDAAVVAFEG